MQSHIGQDRATPRCRIPRSSPGHRRGDRRLRDVRDQFNNTTVALAEKVIPVLGHNNLRNLYAVSLNFNPFLTAPFGIF